MNARTLGRRIALLSVPLVASATLLLAQDYQLNQDPPDRVARISVVDGNVSLEPAGVSQFSAAELNYPLTAGDRVYADNSSLGELQIGGLAVRLGNGADVTISSLTDALAQFGLAQGSLRVRTRDLSTSTGQRGVVEIDTPNGTLLVTRPGDIRVDSYPQADTTVVTVSSGEVEAQGPGLDQQVEAGQSLRLAGSNPVSAEPVRLLPPDALDQFDQQLERQRQQSFQASQQYVDPDMIGAGDLGQYGDWSPDPQYGAVWFPRAVDADWVPYQNGHWAWVAPWGWTWIEAEPWGFAPFHYGRWAQFQGRWGWVPGPPPVVYQGFRPRPVYSPALVAFVGGGGFSLSLSLGGHGPGGGLTAWFPLGPHEAYQPWYHASPAYVNRVNVTNIYNRNPAEVRNNYNNRTTNIYTTNVANVTYVNRTVATTVVEQRDFAAGRRVQSSPQLRNDQNVQRQLAAAPVLPHPLVTPTTGIAAPQAPGHVVPPSQARPVFETRGGLTQGGAPVRGPGMGAVVDTVPSRQPVQNTPPVPARFGATQPAPVQSQTQRGDATPQQRGEAPAQVQPPVQGSYPQQREHVPVAPVTAPQQNPPMRAPGVRAPNQTMLAPSTPPVPVRTAPVVAAPAPATPRPADAPRPLITKATPQPVQPAFQQQQREIERNDPGRPLGPVQVQNMRNGRPAGPPSQPEPVAHPTAPAPAPAKAAPGKPAPAAPEPKRPQPPQ